MHNAHAISILNCTLDNPCFFLRRGLEHIFQQPTISKIVVCGPKHVCFFGCSLELYTPANDESIPGDFDSHAEMSVRVWKGGSLAETLRNYNSGPNVVFETFELYIVPPSV